MKTANYILTTFAPAMFGEKATAHLKLIPHAEAVGWVNEDTKVVSTRVSHEALAKSLFPMAAPTVQRYVDLSADKVAILISYRGPPVPDSGQVPATGAVTYYLIEVEAYQET